MRLWKLAEKSEEERVSIKKANPNRKMFDEVPCPEHQHFVRAVESLSQNAFHDLVALMWFGRRDPGSYAEMRERAVLEKYPNYVTSIPAYLYFRRALPQFGLSLSSPDRDE